MPLDGGAGAPMPVSRLSRRPPCSFGTHVYIYIYIYMHIHTIEITYRFTHVILY